MRSFPRPTLVVVVALLSSSILMAQNVFRASRDHAAIQYSTRPTGDAVARLNQRLDKGELKLASEGPRGYLRSLLSALEVSPSSQALVFSENSLQRDHISKATPRAIYFNDSVMIGWANGSDTIEAAAQDPSQGVIFYSIAQKAARPRFVRRGECLQCHLTAETSGVPGLFMMSVLPLSDNQNEYARGWAMDHRTPIDDRWGGWYVTGAQVPARHLGNVAVSHVPRSYVRAEVAPKLTAGTGAFDTTPYLTPYSDVVALMVLNHQVHAVNLLTRLGWESRIAAHDSSKAAATAVKPSDVRDTARELVDYLLFVDEAPLASAVQGSSPFAEEFAKRGPRDGKGRSLRDLDLNKRLFRYPCSYMIYTDAFDALPADARALVYERLWEILSGKETDKVYMRLSVADRRAIVEILRDTKKGLPEYFQTIIR